MKLYTQITGAVHAMDHDGLGIITPAQSSTKPIKARFVMPGDQVKGTVIKRSKGEFLARVDELTEKSQGRAVPKCPYSGTCGGCLWQFMEYDEQAKLKARLLQETFPEHSISFTPAQEIFYYRNRMDFAFGPQGELGLKESGRWNKYVNLDECHLLHPSTGELLKAVRAWAQKHQLPVFDRDKQQGFLRYLVIREGKNTQERLVMILTSSQMSLPEDFQEVVAPFATHIVHGIRDNVSDLSYAETFTVLKGTGELTESVNGITYHLPLNSFFQTNTGMAAQLQNAVLQELQEEKSVLDLYCGVGFFTLALAKAGKQAKGIEIDPQAIAAAQKAAQANNLQAEFLAAPSEDLSWQNEQPDAIILDPPRAGLHPKVIQAVNKMGPKKIIYISCKYTRFAQEFPQFTGYTVAKMQALDLFPHTPHCELVTTLIKTT